MDKIDIIELLKFLINTYGKYQTILGVGLVILVFFGWRVYQDHRKDGVWEKLIAEKEQTIQRIATENRGLRIIIFRDVHKWSEEQIEKFFITAEI